MHKLWASVCKEFWLLSRDWGGIAILFIMPLALIITITIIQDGTFKTIGEEKMSILLVNEDQGSVSESIHQELVENFDLIVLDSEAEAREKIAKGEYQLAIVIPENLSNNLQIKVDQNVDKLLAKFDLVEDESINQTEIKANEIRLYFDPATQHTFKSSVRNGIDKMISKIETASIYKAFQEQLSEDENEIIFDSQGFIDFKEIIPQQGDKELFPNSVQHNVPAWTLFAIFFIIVPLSINMVKEKTQGTFVRLRTNPVSYATVLGGKTLVYLAVCLIQFILMLLTGVFLFPAMGLPTLDVSGRLLNLFIVAASSGLAAIGMGLLLGTVANTQEQSAPFGATFVVILAALGGVWVPVFLMPKFMQTVSKISPMNWGLNAFYDVFLRQAEIWDLLPNILLSISFFIILSLIAIVYYEKKNAV
ncbi:ABC transporter permease [Algoriphagus chordae]|uniref:ABC-2 type transport system permease protein n=1 Tax=Algoriphagus chordae TaxID=237019 RepID=A0A2W7RDA9_9BACT|nr:ABC transporter permease [Algoriphagus chordae]PZX48725.1 ABC-2 type transport system permease protein [Algoriphagus chordae]